MVTPLWVIVTTRLLLICHLRSGSFPSALNIVESLTLNPYMSLFNLKLCTHIWSTNINFRLPPYIGLFGPSCFELSPYGWIAGGGWAWTCFFLSRTETWLLKSRLPQQRARGATKKSNTSAHCYTSCQEKVAGLMQTAVTSLTFG